MYCSFASAVVASLIFSVLLDLYIKKKKMDWRYFSGALWGRANNECDQSSTFPYKSGGKHALLGRTMAATTPPKLFLRQAVAAQRFTV